MNPTVYIKRLPGDDQGTIGIMAFPEAGFSCFTNELPDRDNQRNISRIPEGEYDTMLLQTQKYGPVYLLLNVPGRDGVLIHSGTWAGDKSKGWKSHVLGCIEVGSKVALIPIDNNRMQRGLLNSRSTRDKFQSLLQGLNFKLIIS